VPAILPNAQIGEACADGKVVHEGMLIEMAVPSILPRSAHRSPALQTRKATTLEPT
jgi:hypothetical protein